MKLAPWTVALLVVPQPRYLSKDELEESIRRPELVVRDVVCEAHARWRDKHGRNEEGAAKKPWWIDMVFVCLLEAGKRSE